MRFLPVHDLTLNRRLQLINTLDGNVKHLELSPTQQKQIETAYGHVAEWLSDSHHPLLSNAAIYPQGSVRLRTTVKPLANDEFDVDVVCFLAAANDAQWNAAAIYHLVGSRLKEHGTYKRMLSPKNRCWRLEYADDTKFHLDITPAIPNPHCQEDGILVPDKEIKHFKASNPIRFSDIFDNISKLSPEFSGLKQLSFAEALKQASIEPLPDPLMPKDLLRRIIQVAKRNRDIFFQSYPGKPPISIIITTLAMQSYAALTRQVFDNPWEFAMAVVRDMPRYIERTGPSNYVVKNPSAQEENFADKWSRDSTYATSFYTWHSQFLQDLEYFAAAEGLDRVYIPLRERLIGPEADIWRSRIMNNVSELRNTGALYRSAQTGLSSVGGVRVQKNTFFGGQ